MDERTGKDLIFFSALFWYWIFIYFFGFGIFLFRSHFLHHFEELEYELFTGGKRALNKEIPRWMDPVIIAFPIWMCFNYTKFNVFTVM